MSEGPSKGASDRALVRRLDLFGCDPDFHRAAMPVLRRFADEFFKVATSWDTPPSFDSGPYIFVSNHEGFFPIDAVILKTVLDPCFTDRPVRPLLEDYVFTMPWVGMWASRLGCVRASQENAARLMGAGHPVIAFPEGVKGAAKTVFTRGRVDRFGRGGVVRLALRTGARVVPVGISGPDHAFPVLFRLEAAGRILGLPFLPVTPMFPLLGPLGLVPLPARFSIVVGEPMEIAEMAGLVDPDELAILKVNEMVRTRVTDLVRRAHKP